MDILLNGKSVPYRPFNEQEQAKVDDDRERFQQVYKRLKSEGKSTKGFNLNTHRQLHVFLLESPQAGDDITYSELPDNVDQIWVRWQDSRGGMGNMPLNRP